MQRYKFTEKNVKQAIAALKGEKGKTPKFYTKYKDKLTTKDGKLFYEKREGVACIFSYKEGGSYRWNNPDVAKLSTNSLGPYK